MDILNYLAIWRRRWVLIVIVVLIGLGSAAAVSALTRPLYAASTQLFITATGGASVVEAYQGNLFGQDRVSSYAQLAAGRQVAQRSIDQLQINMSADDLMSHITAKSVPNTVLLDISVSSTNPDLSKDLTNAVALQTTQLIQELETSARGGSPAAAATLVDEAQTPTSASSPLWGRNLLVGALAGLLVGLVAAIVRDKLDRSVRTPEGAADAAGAGFMGAVPPVKTKSAAGVAFGSDAPESSESFRDLRTNLFAATDGPPEGGVVVAAPDPGTPTAGVTLGLAAAVAQSGRSVLVVEGDLKSRVITEALGVAETTGLADVLSGNAQAKDVVVATHVDGLYVLPAGTATAKLGEQLTSDAMGDLIKQLQAQCDFLLIDGPPVLSGTESVMFAKWSHGLLLVARSGHTSTNDISAAANKMSLVKASIVGVMLSDVKNGYYVNS